jgi:histidine triad (HIT) family protein
VTASEPGCTFCDIVAERASAAMVMRTDDVVAFFPDEPATPGHTLIVPRRHVADIWGITGQDARALSDATLRVAHAVRDAMEPAGLNLIQSNGEAATQSVFHLHVHVLPRYVDDSVGPIWPSSGWQDDSDIRLAYDRIRGRLGENS